MTAEGAVDASTPLEIAAVSTLATAADGVTPALTAPERVAAITVVAGTPAFVAVLTTTAMAPEP